MKWNKTNYIAIAKPPPISPIDGIGEKPLLLLRQFESYMTCTCISMPGAQSNVAATIAKCLPQRMI